MGSSDHKEAFSTLQASDHRWSKLTKPSKRVSNRTYHRSLYPKPSNGGADHLFASADPYSLHFSDLNNPYAQQTPPPPLPSLPSKPCNVNFLSYPPPNNSKSNKRPNNKPSSSSTSTSTSVPLPLTLKKSSPKPKHHPKNDQKMNPKETALSAAAAPVVVSTECLGPDPGELPSGGFVSTKGNPTNLHSGKQEADGIDVELSCPFEYSLAPPPSSLPLPSFALRPKLGCNVTAAAAGVSALLLHPPSVKTNE